MSEDYFLLLQVEKSNLSFMSSVWLATTKQECIDVDAYFSGFKMQFKIEHTHFYFLFIASHKISVKKKSYFFFKFCRYFFPNLFNSLLYIIKSKIQER